MGEVVGLPLLFPLPVSIGVVAAGGVTATELVNRTDVKVQIKRHGDWTVTFRMPDGDPQAGLVGKLSKLRIRFTMDSGTAVLFDAIVRIRQRTIISKEDEAGQGWEITAYEAGQDFAKHRVKIYPPNGIYEPDGGVLSTKRVGHKPFGPTRTFGWPDPACNVSTWTSAAELFQQKNYLPFPFGKYGAPFGWLDGDAWWIWSEAIGGDLAHPIGDVYFHKTFTTAAEQKLIIDSAGDDEYELWLDGQLLTTREQTPDAKAWTRLARTTVTVGPGTHTLRARARNNPLTPGGGPAAGNIGGFICTVYQQAGGAILARTDSSWTCLGYPTDVGMTPGEILYTALSIEPQQRGFPLAMCPSFTFTETLDSAGRAQPRLPKYPISSGSKGQDLLDQLAGAFIEYEWISGIYDDGIVLEMFIAEGTPVVGGGAAPDPSINYDAGALLSGEEGNCAEITYNEDLTALQTALLYLWGQGFSEYGPDSGGIEPAVLVAAQALYGRHEGFLGIGEIEDSSTAFWTAVQNNEPARIPQPTVTTMLSAGAGRFRNDVPMINYSMRHNVPVPDIDAPETNGYMRLVGMTITENVEDGVVEIVPVYFTKFEIWQEKVNRWLKRSALGLQSGTTDVGSPESPNIEGTEIIETRFQTFSGDVATVGEVGTPWAPDQTVVVCQGLALSSTAGGGDTTIALTFDGIVATEQVVIPAGEKRGFSQWNFNRIAFHEQDVNVAVIGDGGHTKISVDVFYAPWPFT